MSHQHQLKFIQLIKSHLQTLPQQSLTQFGKKLFPIMSSNNIYTSLYNCFHTFYTIRINKGEKFSEGTQLVLKYSLDLKDITVYPRIKELLENKEFTLGLEQLIERELYDRKQATDKFKMTTNTQQANQQNNANNNNNNMANNNMNRQSINNNSNISLNGNTSNNNNNSSNNNSNNPLMNNMKKKPSNPNNAKNFVDISEDSPGENITNNNTHKISIPSVNNNSQITNNSQLSNNSNAMSAMNNTDPYQVPNLTDRSLCLCGKSCQLMQPTKDHCFKCYNCQLYYHIECMQRGKNQLNQRDPIKRLAECAFCHLKSYCPMKDVTRVLFAGVLKQGRKRHGITFNLDMMELKTKKVRVQIRSFRLKQKIQTFTLFPDSASFSVNNRFQKQFLPLPKQSSLKYRKDQPFVLTQNLINHQNKLSIIERIPKKQSKDDRIQPQNHLLGIYLVEDKQIPQLVKQVKNQHVFSFYESKALLQRCFKIGDTQDITCQVVKIPIICTLTIERIKTPVRGIFCSHYQCFDLNNFLMLTSTSQNPRWLCPLCKMPAYKFKYDAIVGSIIDQFTKYQATQIMFTKDGEFKVYCNEEVCPGVYTNINDLPIDISYKRPISDVYKDVNESMVIGNQESMRKQNGMNGNHSNHANNGNIISNNTTSTISNNITSNNIDVNSINLNIINNTQNLQQQHKAIQTQQSSVDIPNIKQSLSHVHINNNNNNINGNQINNNQQQTQSSPLNNTNNNNNKQKQSNKNFQIPQNANIISLDDD